MALYARVSTDRNQTVENQLRELHAVAQRSGWIVVAVHTDEGISGAKGRDKRPAYDALLRAVSRREIDLIAAWSVDRLGRSLSDLVAFLGDIQAKGVDLYLHQQGLDTSTPSGRMMFGMLSVFAEFERSIIKERQAEGIARAKARGVYKGRAKVLTDAQVVQTRQWVADGVPKAEVARRLGIGRTTLYKYLNGRRN